MSIDINYAFIAEKLLETLNTNDKAQTDATLSDEERKYLNELGVNGLTDQQYLAALNKINANTQNERESVIEQLKKFTDRIKELVPDQDEFSNIILELFNGAIKIDPQDPNCVEKLFKLFAEKITKLEQADADKTNNDRAIENFLFNRSSYDDTSTECIAEYQNLVKILSSDKKYNANITHNGNKTDIKFNYNGRAYTFSINANIQTSASDNAKDVSTNEKTEEELIADFEEVIRNFASGKLTEGDLEKALADFGFSRSEITDNDHMKYNYRNGGYEITLTYPKEGGKTYTFNCNIGGANDDYESGKTYSFIAPSDVEGKGLTDEQLETYFVKAFVIDGKVESYTINDKAWKAIGLTGSEGIDRLKTKLEEIEKEKEQEKQTAQWINDVINTLAAEKNLKPEQANELKQYMHGDDVKNQLSDVKGKSESEFKAKVKTIAENYIKDNFKPESPKSTDTVTNELSEAQKKKIAEICDTVATAVGLDSTDKDNLKNLVQTAAADWKDDTDFAFEVQKKALEIAQGILKQKNQSSGNNSDLDELISNFTDSGNHSPAVLSELKKYHDNGDISITITQDGSSYEVTITRNGETLGPELVDEQTLRDAGFTINSGVVDLSATTQTYINDIEKSEALLEICRGFMTNGVSINGNNKGKLTFEQTMDVYSNVKADRSYTNTYTNLDTFKDTISKIANEYAVASIQAGTRTQNDATAGQIDEAAKNLTSWGGKPSYNLEGILPATTDDRYDSYPLTSKDFKELYNNDYIVRLHISMDSSESWEDAGKTINRQLNQLGDIITSALGTTNLFDKDILETAKNNIIKKYSDTKFNNEINDDDDGTNEYDLVNNLAWRMKNDRSGTGHRVVGTRDDDGSDSWVWGVRFKDIVDDIIAEYKRLAGY